MSALGQTSDIAFSYYVMFFSTLLLRSFVLTSCTFTGFQSSMIQNCSLGPPGTVKLGWNLVPYQTLQDANCRILVQHYTKNKNSFPYGQNLKTCWTQKQLCVYCNHTRDYKWSFVAYSFPCPLLCVPCGECGITGLCSWGQQHFCSGPEIHHVKWQL